MNISAKNFPVLSNKLLGELFSMLNSKDNGEDSVEVSLDLNISKSTIILNYSEKILKFPDGNILKKPDEFDPNIKLCYFVMRNNLFPIKLFDPETNFYYHLTPTSFRPILRISATQMHKKPFLDYLEGEKIKGVVLDAGTGLGYSASIVCKTAKEVITVEWDSNVIEIASLNPHSKLIFEADNIRLINDDVTKIITNYSDSYFDNIIHDGGTPKSSGNFFSLGHAKQLYRVIKNNGLVYFYLPNKGLNKGRDFAGEQIRRMQKVGFMVKLRDRDGSFTVFIKR